MAGPDSTIDLALFSGQRLRARRKEMGLTQEDVARFLGCTQQQVGKYEAGRDRLSVVRMQSLTQFLGVAFAYFLPNAGKREGQLRAASEQAAFSDQDTEQELALVKSFAAIRDPAARQRVLDLARQLAADGRDPAA